MYEILDQINAVNKAGHYYVALFSALALPDICGALESPDGESSKDRYISWYDRHIVSGLARGQDIYYFRCSLLHLSRTDPPKSQFSRIIFMEPRNTTYVFDNCIVGGALMVDVHNFVTALVTATRIWLKSVESSMIFKNNYKKIIIRYPNGLAPFLTDVPVIG
jgi:hypothetical protein